MCVCVRVCACVCVCVWGRTHVHFLTDVEELGCGRLQIAVSLTQSLSLRRNVTVNLQARNPSAF